MRPPVRKAFRIYREEGIYTLASRTIDHLRPKVRTLVQKNPLTRSIYYQYFDSIDYWEERYAQGGDSGPGSYDDYARFKADVINDFIEEHDIETVVEFGCGDGNQVSLGAYPAYVGFDVSETAIERCKERFSDDDTKRFEVYDPLSFNAQDELSADLVLALEVVFHLVEDSVYEETIRDIFETADRYAIVFSTNYDDPTPEHSHMRHRRFTETVEREFPEFEQIGFVENPFEERISDFYIFERTGSK